MSEFADAGPGDAGPAPDDPTSSRRVEIVVATRTIWQVIGTILLVLLVLRLARAVGGLLTLLALSFFLSLALDPAVRWLHARYGWRRGVAVAAIYATGLLLLVAMVTVLIPAIVTLADVVSDRADDWVRALNEWTNEHLGVPVTSDVVSSEAPAAGEVLARFGGRAFGTVLGIASAGIGLVFSLATIAMFTFYFTAEAPAVQRAVLRLFPATAQRRIGWAWDEAIVQTGGYFYSRVVLMGINGTGFFVVMAIVGVPVSLALPLAVFAGFVSVFIPAVGTYIGSAVPVVLTLALQGVVPALVVLGYALVYQQVENYWLGPRISANTMALNGGVAFGAALAGGAIAGPVGAFVALPVAAMVSALISNYGRSHEVVYQSDFETPGSAA